MSETRKTSEISQEWFEDYATDTEDNQIDEYDITASPNDFNIRTIFDFIESGAVRIPGFQRNYVWDLVRASKLIESLVLGLPVPQIFLYEESRNKFLVIDGQQRLMSIYYFKKQRFPRKEKRSELRLIFDQEGRIPDSILHDDKYFDNFRLSLPSRLPHAPNKFDGQNYATLGEYQTQFDLRTIRNVIIKQNKPEDGDSSIYEIFNRLNTGGMNLGPQEVRTSLYHSDFYNMLYRVNTLPGWRRILSVKDPDLHMKDVEILLRGFAMLIDGEQYAPSLIRFLNQFSKKCRTQTPKGNAYLEELFKSFLQACDRLPADAFLNKRRNQRFNIALYEAVFVAVCKHPFAQREPVKIVLDPNRIVQLDKDSDFLDASVEGTTATAKVKTRLERAIKIVTSV